MNNHSCNHCSQTDFGLEPHALDMVCTAKKNCAFRVARWTGDNLQLTFMHILPGDDIGLEMHEDIEQFIRVEVGCAKVVMGTCKQHLNTCFYLNVGDAVFIPKGYWHNVMNASKEVPLKLSSIYAPPAHPYGTIHQTKEDDPHHQK